MTSRALSRTAHVVFVSILVGAATGAAAIATPRIAHAQGLLGEKPIPNPTPEELQQARDLFQEAYKDEQEKRYDVALEKFRRVANVKESAQVRYRIASVLESMNRLREARDAYRACAAMKASLLPKDAPVADACAEKALAVDKRVPKLVVTISGDNPPPDARVTVDGAPVPTGRPVEQDPGEHTIQGTASGLKPFEQRVTLPDNGSTIPATVAFEQAGTPPPPPPPPPKSSKTLGWIALGAGGVLMVTGIVLLVAREGAIDDIKTACPNQSACNPANRSIVEDKTDTANLFLPLGIGFTAVGALAAGFGVYTIVKKPSASSDPQPSTQGSTSRIDVGPRYVRGGGMLGLSGTF